MQHLKTLLVQEKVKQSKTVTRTRMYLETLEEVLPNIDKYIMSENRDTLKLLPLNGAATLTVEQAK